ncbi:MAG: hypothetical protein H5U02_00310 [Clostridia bacterium]|nr:hypothetical protein [Clostridia bacterium]
MTWSYSNNPAASDKDKVRFLIGDTDQTDQLLQDEEITYLLTETTNVLLAASRAAKAVAARFSRQADKEVGDLRVSLSQKAEAYRKLADDLEKRAGSVAAPSFADQGDFLFAKGMMGWPSATS